MEASRHHLLDWGGPFDPLVDAFVRHALRYGLDGRLRRAFWAVTSARGDRQRCGWEAVAGAVALEAAYRLARRRLDVPSREALAAAATTPESSH